MERHLAKMDCELLYQQMQAASWTSDTKAIERVLQDYGRVCVVMCVAMCVVMCVLMCLL